MRNVETAAISISQLLNLNVLFRIGKIERPFRQERPKYSAASVAIFSLQNSRTFAYFSNNDKALPVERNDFFLSNRFIHRSGLACVEHLVNRFQRIGVFDGLVVAPANSLVNERNTRFVAVISESLQTRVQRRFRCHAANGVRKFLCISRTNLAPLRISLLFKPEYALATGRVAFIIPNGKCTR